MKRTNRLPGIGLTCSLLLTAPLIADPGAHQGNDTFNNEISDLITTEALRPVNARVVTAADRALYGTWGPVIQWPHIPVSAANLPDGRVLTFASNERDRFPLGPEFTYAALYNPSTGQIVEQNRNGHDMFCGAMVQLGDGRPFITGGRNTVDLTSTYDWQNSQWQTTARTNDPRWYPTSTHISGNTVMVASGNGGQDTVELGSPSSFRRLFNIDWDPISSAFGGQSQFFPINFLAPNGLVFHAGPTRDMHWVNPAGNGTLTSAGLTVPNGRYPRYAPTAMYRKGKLVVAGGQTAGDVLAATNQTYTVDLTGNSPVLQTVANMKTGRKFGNGVMLPNGNFFIAAGNTSGREFSDDGAVLECEDWNPSTNTWNRRADITIPRSYHSVGLLLNDGRVFLGGGGLSGTASHNHPDAQIYTPYYLYNNAGNLVNRPQINSVGATQLRRGTQLTVNGSAGVQRFTLTRLMAITHHMTEDCRFLEVDFEDQGGGQYQLDLESNINVMNDGYWYLWALNGNGVPSAARTLRVRSNNTTINVQNVALASSGNNVQVTYSNSSAVQLNNGWMLFLDTDNNTNTGYSAFGRGADYLLRNNNVFRYNGSGTNWAWTYVGRATTNVSGNSATLTFPSNWLANAGNVRAVFYGDRGAFGQNGSVIFPSGGGTVDLNLGGNTIEGIAIDGGLGDWPDADTFRQDPDDIFGAANRIDIRQIYAYLGSQHLFLFWVNDQAIQLNDGWMLFFDTDKNGNTGYKAWGVGGEYMLRNRTVYRYTGNGSNWSWAVQGTATVATNNQYMEAGFPLSWIGGDRNFKMLFFGDNTAYAGGSGFDLLPNDGSGVPVPDNGGGGGNLVSNPGFENGFNSWGDWGDNSYSLASNARSGNRSMAIGATEGGSWQSVGSVSAGETLTASAWAYRTNVNTPCTMGIFFDNANGDQIGSRTAPITSTSYAQVTVSMTAPAGTQSARVWFWKNTNANWLIVDDVTVTK